MGIEDSREPIHQAANRIFEIINDAGGSPDNVDVGEILGLAKSISWMTKAPSPAPSAEKKSPQVVTSN